MNTFQKQLTLKRWILFTSYGWFIGILFVIGFAIIGEMLLKSDAESGGQAAVGIGMGAGVGLMQWLVLRNNLEDPRKWFWFYLISFSASYILADLIAAFVDTTLRPEVILPFATLFGALLCGWLQYRFILKPINPTFKLWMAYSAAGWVLAHMATMSMTMLNMKFKEDIPKFFIVIFALSFLSIGGPLLGFITGKFLVPRLTNHAKDITN